jgi:monofunctional biosynthetic peptidoglycan transglycosylase
MKNYLEIKEDVFQLAKQYYQNLSSYILKHKLLSVFIVLFTVLLTTGVSFYLSLPDVSWLKEKNPKITALMRQRIDEAAKSGKKLRIRQQWVAYKTIPKKLRQAVRVSEDAGFYLHQGIDFEELKESFKKNWEKGEIVRGGSTITQQLAKNLFLSTDRSYLRKLKEYFIAKRLEEELSKARIFHIYLNIIELGKGIFGVQAASRYYFAKNVSQLSLNEMVRLAAIIPRPLKITPNSNSRWLKWKTKWILRKLKLYHYISAEEYNSALSGY